MTQPGSYRISVGEEAPLGVLGRSEFTREWGGDTALFVCDLWLGRFVCRRARFASFGRGGRDSFGISEQPPEPSPAFSRMLLSGGCNRNFEVASGHRLRHPVNCDIEPRQEAI